MLRVALLASMLVLPAAGAAVADAGDRQPQATRYFLTTVTLNAPRSSPGAKPTASSAG